MQVILHNRCINQFKPVLQSRQQVIRAYCPNIYTVILCEQKLSREGGKKREAHLVNLDVSWRFDLGTIHVEIKKLLKDWVLFLYWFLNYSSTSLVSNKQVYPPINFKKKINNTHKFSNKLFGAVLINHMTNKALSFLEGNKYLCFSYISIAAKVSHLSASFCLQFHGIVKIHKTYTWCYC